MKSTQAPPTSLCLFALLCVRLVTASLFFYLSTCPLLFLSKSSLFRVKLFRVHLSLGFFSLFPHQALGLLADDTHRK